MSTEGLLQCYNKGCGQKFDSTNIDQDACVYHPGQPVFHDAEKRWSCCNQRSKDFTMFLNIPGCTKGCHNPVKPEEPKIVGPADPTPAPIENNVKEVKKERPSFDSELIDLKTVISPSLAQLLKASSDVPEKSSDGDPTSSVRVGEPCKRNGCNATYESSVSNLEECQYHPGGPVFHEGLKFWSCCKRKKTDFTEFLATKGCEIGHHLWRDDKSSSKKAVCRYDWHQTGSHVYITVYAKASKPTLSKITVNPVRMSCSIIYGDNLQFDLDLELHGMIDPQQSIVTFAATKVELKLKKDGASTWSKLMVNRKEQESEVDNESKTADAVVDPELDVDGIDLSDI